MKEKLLTCKEAALILDSTEVKVRVDAHRGNLPYYQLPRGIRFKKKDLHRYLKERNRWIDFKSNYCGLKGFIDG